MGTRRHSDTQLPPHHWPAIWSVSRRWRRNAGRRRPEMMGFRSMRVVLRNVLMLLPSALLLGVVVLVFLGYRVTAVLRQPALYGDASPVVQTLTRAVYWRTRTHWQMNRECAEFDPELLYRPRPGRCEFGNAEFSTTMNFDERGARRTPVPAATADGRSRPRVVVLGDSYAMGWGVEDHETFAALLSSRFGYPTVNLGVSSYATPRELRRLERDFELLESDVIVIQYCENDLEENLAFAASPRTGPYRAAELEKMQRYIPTRVAPLPVAGLILRIVGADFLRRLGAAFNGSGAEPAARLEDTDALLAVIGAYSQWRNHATYVIPIARPGQVITLASSKLERAGIGLIVPQLSPDDFFSIDDHLRPRGHEAVARAIADRLGSAGSN